MDTTSIVYQGQNTHIFLRFGSHSSEVTASIPGSSQEVDLHLPMLEPVTVEVETPLEQPCVTGSELCVCCRVYPSTYVIPACSHLCLCDPCRAILLVSDYPRCPLCRANMTDRPLPPMESKKDDKEDAKNTTTD